MESAARASLRAAFLSRREQGMKVQRFAEALDGSVAAMLLAGYGGSQSPIGAPGAMPHD
jgi:hypothetical protein